MRDRQSSSKEMAEVAMNAQEETFIRKWGRRLKHSVQVRTVRTDDPRSDAFRSFGERLARLAPRVAVRDEKDDDSERPGIEIAPNLCYHCVPLEKELEPFLNALHLLSDPGDPGISAFGNADTNILPATLEVYISLHCSFCPGAVGKLIPLALNSPAVRLSIIDAVLFPEAAKNASIRSVPTIILDGRYRWAGDPPLQEVVSMMVNRDPATLSADSMEAVLKDGQAMLVARVILEHGVMFPWFVDLLVNEKWPVRLGAMVAMETLAEKDVDLARQAAIPLWERFEQAVDPVKGDILYLLGEIGDQTTLRNLEALLAALPGRELLEAGKEAVERIQAREIGNR